MRHSNASLWILVVTACGFAAPADLTIEIKDYVTMPITGAVDGTGNSGSAHPAIPKSWRADSRREDAGFETVAVVRSPKPDPSFESRYWAAPALNYFPLREAKYKNGELIETV